jgi:hypothetical protein
MLVIPVTKVVENKTKIGKEGVRRNKRTCGCWLPKLI